VTAVIASSTCAAGRLSMVAARANSRADAGTRSGEPLGQGDAP
jgi:hypothetical protein